MEGPPKTQANKKFHTRFWTCFFSSESLIFFFIFYYLGYRVYPLGHSFKALALSP